ncbi:MAG: YsnF/AvaK domain-containing protein [Acidobacteria bacterium]|nr:YsnF/AvaK domain-containing protein [Acidobacteriota bacterium]
MEQTDSVNSERLVVPILNEELKISREKVVTGGVRVHKTVQERTETVDQPTFEEKIEVERVTVNQFVDAPPPVRYEGDVMIMPLLEEVLVVEKRLVLREEVRISKRRETVNKPQQIVLRREDVTVERIEPSAEQTKNVLVDEQNRREN